MPLCHQRKLLYYSAGFSRALKTTNPNLINADMNKLFTIILLLTVLISTSRAQESEEAAPVVEKDKPVRSPWESGYLIDAQTSLIHVKNTFEFVIQHKFGTIENGSSDLWGIYAPGANVRIALNFVPYKNVKIGWGITKKNMYNDFNAKWTIVEQTRKNTVPVSVTLFGLMAIDGRSTDFFKSQQYYQSSDPLAYHKLHEYRFSERYSYFSQLIIGRKFTEWLTLQAGASFSHFNLVGVTGDHDKIGAHLAGRIKFSPQLSYIFNCDVPLKIKKISEQREWIDPPKPNLACGLEISTSTHAFQIYIGSSDGILPQEMMVNNQKDWKNKGLSVGFTITRLWFF
jgi:hypothetical protein